MKPFSIAQNSKWLSNHNKVNHALSAISFQLITTIGFIGIYYGQQGTDADGKINRPIFVFKCGKPSGWRSLGGRKNPWISDLDFKNSC